MGYTYGAGDVPPKIPQGSGAVWKWVTDPEKYDYWKKALQWDSALQMQYVHDFLAAIEWWRLEPAHELIRSQPDDGTRRMALARTAAGILPWPTCQTMRLSRLMYPPSLRLSRAAGSTRRRVDIPRSPLASRTKAQVAFHRRHRGLGSSPAAGGQVREDTLWRIDGFWLQSQSRAP